MEGLLGRLDLGSLSDPSDGWAPRLGIAYDVVGDGRSRLFASWGRYNETMPTYLASFALGRLTAGAYLCGYGPDAKPFTPDDPEPEVLYEVDSSLAPTRVEPDLETQYLDEAVLGF